MLDKKKEGNPFLNKANFDVSAGETMTMAGTSFKSLALLAIMMFSATISYNPSFSPGMALGAALGAFVLAMIAIFKPNYSVILAPVYAFLEGIVLGYVSVLADVSHPGTAMQAIMGTFGVFIVMAILYSKKIIVVNSKYISFVMSSMMGILFIYLADIILRLFGINLPVIHDNSMWGIIFSLVIVGIASMNLAIDFERINENVQNNAPKYMEWYSALGLMISLVWLYMEILRLLNKAKK